MTSEKDWLEARRFNITATDIAAIVGECKYGRTRYDVLCDKLGANVFIDNGYTRFGRVAEAIVAARCQEIYDWLLVDDGATKMVQHHHFPWATATLDRWYGVTDSLAAIPLDEAVWPAFPVEIKTGSWKTLPKNYWWQCQWQMFCTNTCLNLVVQSKIPGPARVHFDPRDYESEEAMLEDVREIVARNELIIHEVRRSDDAVDRALAAAMEFRHTQMGFLR